MECNRDEAIMAKELAEKKMSSNDYVGARKMIFKAQKLYPSTENITQMLIVCEVHCSAECQVHGLDPDWYSILQIEQTADEAFIKNNEGFCSISSVIEGIIILNAHNLNETCTESFIVRIFRGLNKVSYVRAFSDKPNSMVAGFGKTERIMKCLLMRKLHLWPRFQVYVSQDLEKDPPVVVDVRVGMSGLMKGIQKAVIEAMDACLKELKKTNKVDVDDLTVENGLFKSFDEIVRRQLDPIWHVLGKKTNQLVMDLKTLRKLLDYLVRYDAVTYLKYLDTLRVSEGVRSIWIMADSSQHPS